MSLIKCFFFLVGIDLLFLVVACVNNENIPTDDYNDCESFLTLNKDTIRRDDTLLITLNIPYKGEGKKAIKIFKNLANFELSSSFIAICYPDNPSSGECSFGDNDMILETAKQLPQNVQDIQSIVIGEGKTYQRTLAATVKYDKSNDIIIIKVEELGKEIKFSYRDYKKYNRYKLQGFLTPINAPFGYSFEDGVRGKEVKFMFD